MRFVMDLKLRVNDETLTLKHTLDCSKEELAERLYEWCKDYELNVAECETVIESLIINGEEDLKEEVLKLEVQHFLTLPDDDSPNKKPLP
ncbi:hypothetical protein AS034_05140 [[Bacillus] enclensis]|uniref:Uncharacterized protein n=1 Tax=[Bacillus] enclensis TaxID=1402860 RepID=A0A0V8HML4_9BACI|nr:hypothetical protein [[Bacillus] enclensis]KSU63634.1 hypothetical protein AS034_05140 [[Bacillus] enclensis]SCB87255.1 hypothetical protein GA0061094_1072 [[Bacillus] enclensis]